MGTPTGIPVASHCYGLMTTAEGQLLHDRYRLISRIGAGGQASVWQAEDTLLERRVALKELVPHRATIGVEETRERALIEARALARVRHRCIVRVHDIFFWGEDPWIVMEYIRGRNLADVFHQERPGDRAIAALGLSVLQGLQAVHAAGIVHRDIKPTNILVDQDGAVFLVDFGIAKIIEQAQANTRYPDGLTGLGRVLGTPEYISPEQIKGESATAASDLWSLGVTLYFALEGRTPFARRSASPVQAIQDAILYDDPLPPGRQGRLARLALELLHKNPQQRPSAEAAMEVLESILTDRQSGGTGRTGNTEQGNAAPWPQDPVTVKAGTLVYTKGMQPLDEAELTRRGIADAARAVNPAGADSGVARLLDMPNRKAADILNECSIQVAAQLVADIAAAHPRKAGELLPMLTPTRSGKILDNVPAAAGAAVIDAVPRDQRARVLSKSDIRTIADILRALPDGTATRLVTAMPRERAVKALGHVRASKVALIIGSLDQETRTSILNALPQEVRHLVRRNL
jgi:tRNA A-37 threonylcarbamoyl transferase component Bud32